MLRSFVLKVASATLVTLVLMSAAADQAQAWWWRHCGWGGYWGYPVVSTYYYPSYGYSSCYAGRYRPWLGCHRCSWCYCDPCSCGGYSLYSAYVYPSYTVGDSCCGSVVSSGPVQKGIVTGKQPTPAAPEIAPVEPAIPEAADTPPALPSPAQPALPTPPEPSLPTPPPPAPAETESLLRPGSSSYQQPTSTVLAVSVPEDARVYVNGMLTKTPGTLRRYVSRHLVPGYQYTYEIRAEVVRNGRRVSDVQTVRVRAGETSELAFRLNGPAARETLLTVHVPADATVTLEGQPTQMQGAERTYATTALTPGQQWDNYRVQVQWNRGGRVQTEEKTLTLVGGQAHVLNFDLGSQQVAAR